jgi:8-oxo-dGTP pyrophosphatase MutT (NUDIX family)
MWIKSIRERLREHSPVVLEAPGRAYAAVSVVLRDGGEGAEFIVIHRAHRRGDPWSGHMALPGGRQQPCDSDLLATAVRETREEIGVDLAQHGEVLGALDDVQAVGRGRVLDLVIRPIVYALLAPVELRPDHNEVQSAFWVPLASLRRSDVRGTYRHRSFGQEHDYPAFLYNGYTIWGLTHRILTGFLDRIA